MTKEEKELQELENAGWDYVNFYKKYDHE